ncbi:MAG: ACS family sodium-dependent inorganic phosphate cotransporter, partial [Bacillariaceae sp.]|jgi:ACS family sodium-dependent inorganic phosphate cotransporter
VKRKKKKSAMIILKDTTLLFFNISIICSTLFSVSSSFLIPPTICDHHHLVSIGISPSATQSNFWNKRKSGAHNTHLFTALKNKKDERTCVLEIPDETLSILNDDDDDTNAGINAEIISIEPPGLETITTNYNDEDEDEDNKALARTMMVLIFAVGSLCSLDRVAMSVALVPMSQEMGISDTVKGSISSFFSVGYGLAILPAGLLLSRLSPRLIMAAGICLWSVGTIATPFTIAQGDVSLLLGARALVGASESVVVPTIQRLLSEFVKPEKKSFAIAIVFCGFQFGTIMAYSLSPMVIDYFSDWRSVFILYGGAGLLFLVPWLMLAKDSPAAIPSTGIETTKNNNKMIIGGSNKEFNFFSDNIDQAKQILQAAPWKEFTQSRGVLAMFLAHAANNWGLYNNLSWTPTFYSEQYGMNVKESAVLLVVPSIVGAIGGLAAGSIADSAIQNLEIVTDDEITRIRRSFQALGLLVPAVCLAILASRIPEEPWVAQILFALAVGFQSFNAAGYGAANQEKAGPQWTGLLYSVTSLPSVMVGTFGVYLTGEILDATNQNWSYVWGLNAFVYALGGIAFATLYDSRKEFD